ncbi:tyrosine-type recombinase/integrase [Cellulomonas gelida]|uniref:Tyr recombinase domain-containing protein n=1 Tax=Cellulomonas gelida TaxID=1712 RepID=A0A4Y3KPG1_9CELL|nr:tyrosine-type recombinase/integrase [Cellulomonas gelida]GEA84820.1 hypothetical protein CGE01nite_20710 [Cellulomonas gelida]GGL16136.1 hypothetical protein GCM10009774_03140 [Cellulomonas gelida]
MSVTRRAYPTGNVTWRAKVFFEGRVNAQRSLGRRVDAKRWEADQLAELDAGSWIDPAKRTSGAVFGPTKTHQARTVPVPAALDEYVRTRVAFTAPGGYLFSSPAGSVWTNTNFRARSGWMEATRRAGVEGTTIHDLRHTAAALLIAAGADVKAVQVIRRP